MQVENEYDKVYNGDIGYVVDVDPEPGELTVSFNGRVMTYGFGELDVVVPAYAATIHKSQGSVSVPVLTQHYPMLQRKPVLHRRHPRQAPCGSGRPEEGGRDRGSERVEPPTVVEIGRMAQAGRLTRFIKFGASPTKRFLTPQRPTWERRREVHSDPRKGKVRPRLCENVDWVRILMD
jgi:hypothetical protein